LEYFINNPPDPEALRKELGPFSFFGPSEKYSQETLLVPFLCRFLIILLPLHHPLRPWMGSRRSKAVFEDAATVAAVDENIAL
jgi:hypothetical protein